MKREVDGSLIKKDKAIQFMRLALMQASQFSKDQSTQVAAMVLGKNTHEIRSSGYNGMPRGCHDDKKERHERPEKYLWFEHAERNAIYNAARVGTPLEGGILIVTMAPCMDCARAIVQAGIVGVVSLAPTTPDALSRWGSHIDKSDELFNEVGIVHQYLTPEDLYKGADTVEVALLNKWLKKGP